MNSHSGNVPIHLNTIVEDGTSHRVNFQMCFLLPFEMMVRAIQDSARTKPEQPHYLAHEMTITIDGQSYPFHSQLDFKQLSYSDKKSHKIEMTVRRVQLDAAPTLPLFYIIVAYVLSDYLHYRGH